MVTQNALACLITCLPYKHKITEDVALLNRFEMWRLEATRRYIGLSREKDWE